MNWTEPRTWWNYHTAHMMGGGLSVLATSWGFSHLGSWYYFLVLLVPFSIGLAREIYQYIAEDNNFRMASLNVSEWLVGGSLFAIAIRTAIATWKVT